MDNLKAEQIGSSKWRVLAIPFGGPMKGGKDLDGEWFDADTDIKARWFKERPVLFHHGQDPEAGAEDLGVQDDLTEEKDGWWGTMWLDRSSRYWAQVDKWLREGKAFGSSGAVAHLVRKSKTGHIDVWPHAEQTITLTPANPFARITASKVLAGFDSAGIGLDDTLKSLLDELDRRADDLGTDLPASGEPSGDLGNGGEDPATLLVARADAFRRADALRQRLRNH